MKKPSSPSVLLVLGSDSDLPVAEKCAEVLDQFEVTYRITISSAHRSPERTMRLAKEASEEGFKLIIAFAGAAAALPGVIASHTVLPVIGVPVSGKALLGLDALFSIAQMPAGVPVAAVGLDAGKNAALLALRMLALDPGFERLTPRLRENLAELARQVERKAAALESRWRG